ncbi:hypothetical protein V8C44DRAFT_363537 [Trichoderma aethiopicum]
MRQSLSNLKGSLVRRLKRSHHGDTSSSAADDALALSSPPSVQSQNGQPQSAQPKTVRAQEVQSKDFGSQRVHSQTVRPSGAQPQAAQSLEAPLHTVSKAATATSLTRNGDDLWALAFSMVQMRESKLMLAYEEYLSTLPGDAAVDANISVPDFVKSVVDRAIQDREEKKWHVSLLGADVEVRKQAERLVKLLLWSEPIVKAAVSNQPYAALAWSGVSILLPLVTSSITQNEAMLKGFNAVGDVQVYWNICEKTNLPSLDGPCRQHFVEPLAKLYSYVVEYQARVICHLSKTQLARAWSDISSPEEWDSKIQEIDRLNEECRNILGLLNADQIEKQWKQQLREMQESRDILEEIRDVLQKGELGTRETYKEDKTTELLHLLASDYQGHKNFNRKREKGTCEWFFADERFRNWRDSDESRLLWVSADPGCGKSVLSRALIDERRLSTKVTTSTVCYFFFKDGDESRMYAHNALCAILHQLFTQDLSGNLAEQALASHRNFGATLAAVFTELWSILTTCADSPDCGEIICLIDALDECHVESRTKLMDALEGFYRDSSKRPSRLKFLVTSRPYDDIELSFRQFDDTAKYLRLNGDDKSADIGKDINLVIDASVKELNYFEEGVRRLIVDRLKSTENRTYLWLYLTIDIIKRSPSEFSRPIDVENFLSNIPAEISEAYEKILGRSKAQRYAEALLKILLAAARPLSLKEANYALTLATKEQAYESHEALEQELWPMGSFKEYAKNLCGLFISVHDGKLFFIHQTAREFLLSSRSKGNWQGRFTMPKSHSTLSSACLRYLLLPDLPAKETAGGPPPPKLFLYAAIHWPLHYNSQDDAEASLSRKDARKLCCPPAAAHPWLSHYCAQRLVRREFRSALSLASFLGLGPVVLDLLQETADNDSIGKALPLAAAEGHTGVIRMLLDHGAGVNAKSDGDGTALQTASSYGHAETVQMLLDLGADVNAVSDRSHPALVNASSEGHMEIVQMLLGHGADVTVAAGKNYTAIIAASWRGHRGIVQALLDHGADANAKTDHDETALQAAAYRGYTEIARMLLDHGADVNAKSDGDETALQVAAYYGYTEIVQVLLDRGVDVNAFSGRFGTALAAAAWHGRADIVKLLLDNGADINSNYWAPLHIASKRSLKDVVRMLLDHGGGDY